MYPFRDTTDTESVEDTKMQAQLLVCLMALSTAFLQPTVADGSSEDNPVSERKTIIICEGSDVVVTCPPNSLIEVHDAFYGRMEAQHCPHGPGVGHTSCTVGPRALFLTRALCNNRRTCQLNNFNGVFGDPCHGVYKYARVTYSCRALPTTVTCDDEVFKIQCPAGKYIWLREAFYGRVSNQHCNRGPRPDMACSLPYAMEHITSMCNNKEKCEFPRGMTMPDPCPGTFKYLTAAYECRDHMTQYGCDGAGRLVIECAGNKVIQIKHASIARTSEEYCGGPRHTLECSSPTAHQVISQLCNNRHSCSVSRASVPDPCIGTWKTTYVEYKCI